MQQRWTTAIFAVALGLTLACGSDSPNDAGGGGGGGGGGVVVAAGEAPAA